MPSALVLPSKSCVALHVRTETRALADGRAVRQACVTHTSELSRPNFRCTAMFVTSALVAT